MASALLNSVRRLSTVVAKTKHVCIIGSGPAGFYAAQQIAKNVQDVQIDIIEKLPVPFGLVRFGVAPDHPEVKNVINTFTKTAQHEKVNFYGNITLGRDVTLSQLRDNYHAVLLAYGAEHDRKLDIPNEDSSNILSARSFVGWYNGVPGDQNLKVDLCGSSVAVLGQGNVAMDVARILLTPIDVLKKTDITEHSLAVLAQSKVKNVHLIGRRGPLQAAFTIKELREQINLPQCKSVWRENDFNDVHSILNNLPRPRKRITELMLKSLSDTSSKLSNFKRFLPIFHRSPVNFLTADSGRLIGIELALNRMVGEDILTQTCTSTEQREILNCDLVLRSIGYMSIQVDGDINFNASKGYVLNSLGRVLALSNNERAIKIDDSLVDPGLYVTGWLRTGPLGVILTTMSNAFEVAGNICKDFETHGKSLHCHKIKPGFEGIKCILKNKNVQIVDWNDWKKIDKFETEAGKKVGKPREKICDIEKMLAVCS